MLLHGAHPGERMIPLATIIANEGFAAFTYDRRGTGKSGGDDPRENVSAERLRVLGQDAVAAATLVSAEFGGDAAVGIVGLSHAGWVAPLAASMSRAIRFFGLWSGPVCTTSEELHFSALAERDPDFWRTRSDVQVAEYMKSVEYRPDDLDPSKTLAGVSVPALWIFGGKDNSIPVALSIARLQALIRDGRSNFRYRLIPDDGHNLADSPRQEGFRYMISWLNELAAGELQEPER